VPAHSKNRRLAHEFINFFCLPHIAAKNMEWSGFRSTIGEARSLLPPELREHPILYPAPELLQRCEQLEDLGDALSLYEKTWGSLLLG
jgi:spermidine/putrescine transport system substrate-binding protein